MKGPNSKTMTYQHVPIPWRNLCKITTPSHNYWMWPSLQRWNWVLLLFLFLLTILCENRFIFFNFLSSIFRLFNRFFAILLLFEILFFAWIFILIRFIISRFFRWALLSWVLFSWVLLSWVLLSWVLFLYFLLLFLALLILCIFFNGIFLFIFVAFRRTFWWIRRLSFLLFPTWTVDKMLIWLAMEDWKAFQVLDCFEGKLLIKWTYQNWKCFPPLQRNLVLPQPPQLLSHPSLPHLPCELQLVGF